MIIYSHQSNKMKNRCEFANNENKVRFYTGVSSFDTLVAVFLQDFPYVSCDTLNLAKFREFAMTLMKLKLDMPLKDLSYRFGVSRSTVSRLFSMWKGALDIRL